MGLLDKAEDKMHELKGRAEQKIKDSKADSDADTKLSDMRHRNQNDETVDTL